MRILGRVQQYTPFDREAFRRWTVSSCEKAENGGGGHVSNELDGIRDRKEAAKLDQLLFLFRRPRFAELSPCCLCSLQEKVQGKWSYSDARVTGLDLLRLLWTVLTRPRPENSNTNAFYVPVIFLVCKKALPMHLGSGYALWIYALVELLPGEKVD